MIVFVIVVLVGIAIALGESQRRLRGEVVQRSSSSISSGSTEDHVNSVEDAEVRYMRRIGVYFDMEQELAERKASLLTVTDEALSHGRTLTTTNVAASEMAALQGLYTSLGGSAWKWQADATLYGMKWDFTQDTSSNYLHDPCLELWQGVWCSCNNVARSTEPGAEFSYYYYQDFISGAPKTLPDTTYCSVQKIVLSGMSLSSSFATLAFANLPKLTRLFLGQNQITGDLSALCSLPTTIVSIDMRVNKFKGSLPSCLGSLTNLVVLHFLQNSLTGSIPSQLNQLASLKLLVLGSNSLTGHIPDFSGLASLGILNLQKNKLSGSISSTLALQSTFFQLNLDNNKLTGTLPPTLCSSVGYMLALTLNSNKLHGQWPSQYDNLPITVIDMHDNSLTGSLPAFANSAVLPSFLLSIDLSKNSFGGSIPIGWATNLVIAVTINLASNLLTGTIVPFANIAGLTLKLYSNQLSGNLTNVKALISISQLDIHNNKITGDIPSCLGTFSILTYLNLASNSIHSTIPSSLSLLTTAATIRLSQNSLFGSIPSELTALNSNQGIGVAQLTELSLDSNSLTGAIPGFLFEFTSLQILRLENNLFSGNLPSTFTSGITSTPLKLQVLTLGGNMFSGTLPSTIGYATNLKSLVLASCSLHGALPSSLGALVGLSHLELQNNMFTSSIPSGFSGLVSMKTLFMNDNKLTSSIPSLFGGLLPLQTLCLANNRLVGVVPPKLSSLLYLEDLDLRGNRLTGGLSASFCSLLKANTSFSLHIERNNFTSCLPSCFQNMNSAVQVTKDASLPFCPSTADGIDTILIIEVVVPCFFFLIVSIFLSCYYHAQVKRFFLFKVLPELDAIILFAPTIQEGQMEGRVEELARMLRERRITPNAELSVQATRSVERNIRIKVVEMGCCYEYANSINLRRAKTVIVCLTDTYKQHINSTNERDVVRKHFRFVVDERGPQVIIPVVMDTSLLNQREWQGELQACIGRHLYVDMCDDQRNAITDAARVSELVAFIQDPSQCQEPSECFMAHNWGAWPDFANHANVGRLNSYLKDQGVKTWYDQDRMKGDVKLMMRTGIEKTRIVAVFVTSVYQNKVNSNNLSDNCCYEFRYACSLRGSYIIPVIVDASMRDLSLWRGDFGSHVARSPHIIDMVDAFDSQDEVVFNNGANALLIALRNMMAQQDADPTYLNPFLAPNPATAAVAAVVGGGGGGGGGVGGALLPMPVQAANGAVHAPAAPVAVQLPHAPLAAAGAGIGGGEELLLPDDVQPPLMPPPVAGAASFAPRPYHHFSVIVEQPPEGWVPPPTAGDF